jgi:eukaryotic-like serine/threonine-protein kinase
MRAPARAPSTPTPCGRPRPWPGCAIRTPWSCTTLGPEHPLVASSLANLAVVETSQGDLLRARTRFERALAIQEATLGAEHTHLADTLAGLVGALAGLEDWVATERTAERALAFGAGSLTPIARARVMFALARALDGQNKDRARATELATHARTLEVRDGDALRAEIDRFLARR